MTADRSPADVAREIADSIVPDDPLSHTILFSRPDLHGRLTTAIASALRTAEQRVWEEAAGIADGFASGENRALSGPRTHAHDDACYGIAAAILIRARAEQEKADG